MTPSAPPASSRHMTDVLVEGDTETVDQLIARVLRRAHLTADAHDEPDEARAILHVAHSFADELAAADPGFDRMRFIEDATSPLHDTVSDPARPRL